MKNGLLKGKTSSIVDGKMYKKRRLINKKKLKRRRYY